MACVGVRPRVVPLSLKIICTIGFLLGCDAKTTRFLTTYPIAQDALVGSSFTFEWKYELANGVSVESVNWILDPSGAANRLIGVAGNGALVPNNAPASYSGRIKWTGDLSKFTASFLLMNITSRDAKQYQVVIGFGPSPNALKDYVLLNVLEPAYFKGSEPSNQSLAEGQDLTLICEAGGKPQPNITWVNVSNDQVVQKGKGSSALQINKITRPSNSAVSYVYECQAVNIHGRAAIKKKTWITVKYAPEGTRLITNAVSDTVDKGDDVTLTCGTTGAVPAVDQYKFYFEKDGTSTKIADSKQKTHQITDVKGSDQGKYKCVPHNSVGDGQEATVNLTVKVPVNITDISNNQTVKEGKSFQLNCKADGQPAPTITWTKAGKQLFHNTTYVVSKSKRNDTGEYVCKAENQHSKDAASVQVTVQYKAKIVTASSSTNTSSYIGQKVTLTCAAEGVPVPTLEWIKPGGSPLKPGEQSNSIAIDVDLKTEADFGLYQCSAKNTLADDVLTIYINQQISTATTPKVATTEGGTFGEGKVVGDKTGSGMIIGVAVGAVLFVIITVALGFMIWRKRSHQGGKGNGSVTPRDVLSADDEGYESVSRRAAVQNLGAGRDGAYADVGGNSSVYAQVDKSKKNPKKPKKKPGEPGELVYADLADFSRPRGGAVPVRPEEIQRSDYADITQFSAPKQEPTYDNLPRADATYANVQAC